jgi:hypothetical protein
MLLEIREPDIEGFCHHTYHLHGTFRTTLNTCYMLMLDSGLIFEKDELATRWRCPNSILTISLKLTGY